MSKKNKIIMIVVLVIVFVAVIAVSAIFIPKIGKNEKSNLPQISNEQDLVNLVNKVYEGITTDLYNVNTTAIDLTDSASVKSYTGLENGQDFEYAVVSEPFINAQAYSLIIAKVKDGVNANEIAKKMSEEIDTRKWICVSAEKVYATSSGDIVFLIMTNEEMAKSVYDSFKNLAGTTGEVYEKTAEEEVLPSDNAIFQIPE